MFVLLNLVWTALTEIEPICTLPFPLCAGIGVTHNVSLEELYAVAINKEAVEIANSYADLPNDVDRASVFINSFPCQKNVKPTCKYGYFEDKLLFCRFQ